MKLVILTIALVILSSLAWSASDWYESTIVFPSPFQGNHKEIFILSDGSVWEVRHEYNYFYSRKPSVLISESKGKAIVEKKEISVKFISRSAVSQDNQMKPREDIVESRVDGVFNGWKGDTVVKLQNGQIWQQTQYYYRYIYKYRPSVMIYKSGTRYKMIVDGIDKEVYVKRLQ